MQHDGGKLWGNSEGGCVQMGGRARKQCAWQCAVAPDLANSRKGVKQSQAIKTEARRVKLDLTNRRLSLPVTQRLIQCRLRLWLRLLGEHCEWRKRLRAGGQQLWIEEEERTK